MERFKIVKIFFFCSLMAMSVSSQPIETISGGAGGYSLALLKTWGQVALETILEWAKRGFPMPQKNGTKVLVVTGIPRGSARITEIIDLENPSYTCNKVQPIPINLAGATGGLVEDKPMVCGGSTEYGYSRTCFSLQENGEWMEIINPSEEPVVLSVPKGYAASGSVIMNDKLVVAGGRGLDSTSFSSIELVSPNGSTMLPIELPHPLYQSCMVKWDENTFLVIGGYAQYNGGGYRRDTYFVHLNNNTVTNGPSLQNGRQNHACQNMIVNDQEYVVVTGGGLMSTEVLSKSFYENGWKLGAPLYYTRGYHGMVASNDQKFLYAIGDDSSEIDDLEIYKLTCGSSMDHCGWEQMDTKLEHKHYLGVAFAIPDALADKLCN